MKILRHPTYAVQAWKNGGGTTYEIARSPNPMDSEAEGAWDWRISMALIASSGPFSHFEGVDRTLVMVEGEVSLLTRGEESVLRPYDLRPYDLIRFAGEDPTTASLLSPVARDFNVMVRRAWGSANVTVGNAATIKGPGLAFALGETETLAALGNSLDRYDALELEPGEALRLDSTTTFFLFAEFLRHAR